MEARSPKPLAKARVAAHDVMKSEETEKQHQDVVAALVSTKQRFVRGVAWRGVAWVAWRRRGFRAPLPIYR